MTKRRNKTLQTAPQLARAGGGLILPYAIERNTAYRQGYDDANAQFVSVYQHAIERNRRIIGEQAAFLPLYGLLEKVNAWVSSPLTDRQLTKCLNGYAGKINEALTNYFVAAKWRIHYPNEFRELNELIGEFVNLIILAADPINPDAAPLREFVSKNGGLAQQTEKRAAAGRPATGVSEWYEWLYHESGRLRYRVGVSSWARVANYLKQNIAQYTLEDAIKDEVLRALNCLSPGDYLKDMKIDDTPPRWKLYGKKRGLNSA